VVPLYLISNKWKFSNSKTITDIEQKEKEASGLLSDVAPTILEIFNLSKPQEMTGSSVLKTLNLS
jgi:bisphosphoglycerate-independent phosphoglycerate mutase (AlkP superfamily)